MLRALLFIIGFILLLGAEVLRVYFIMPFPGSQRSETIDLAYFLHHNIAYFRILGLLLLGSSAFHLFRAGGKIARGSIASALVIYALVCYFFNFRFLADKMFYEPKHKIFAEASSNQIPQTNLVLGVSLNGESKAYPLEIIGYHHQVRDTIGNTPVMITYCTVCRTGRVFNPVLAGKLESFRLVGMDHFNAMFEDASTKSWWRQVNGEAIAGPLQGTMLEELPSEQMRLAAWLEHHPNSLIMQPDSAFQEEYEGLKNYDEGKGKSALTRADSLSWQEKSWILGVQLGAHARAYDWNDLLARRVLNDTLAGVALVVAVENDSASFHVWQRDSLTFRFDAAVLQLQDEQTHSLWNWKGECIAGALQGRRLQRVQSYQEFWHSWRTFRPHTTRFSSE
ncbi:MAG: DUF3179 domain-containing (seleno)protein [candidate division KSB1 bacterium]